jgi:cobalt-zinc-cadmium efflux system membrane fusion protein
MRLFHSCYEPDMNETPNTIVVENHPPESTARPSARRHPLATSILGYLPTVAALAGLVALAWWGHRSDWKLPAFSGLTSSKKPEPEDWCKAHFVPESICVECKPERLPRHADPGWCAIHGVPECPEHHPEIAQVDGTPLLPRYDTAAALRVLPRPVNERECKLHERRIQFESIAAMDKAGISTVEVGERLMGDYITANGEVTFDPARVARVSSAVAGRIWRVEYPLGASVKKGDILAMIDSAEVGKAKADFMLAIAQLQVRQRTVESLTASEGAVKGAMLREAEAAVQEAEVRLLGAEQALANLGLPVRADQFRGMSPTEIASRIRVIGLPKSVTDGGQGTANLLPLRAPLDGMIVKRDIVAGEVVDATKLLFIVAEPREMILTLQVREEDARYLKPEQLVRFTLGGGDEVTGPVTWISPTVDDKTRTVPVQVLLDNKDGRLRNNTFGTGRVVLREEPHAIVVPNEAVHWDGSCHVVFVRNKNFLDKSPYTKVFHVRKVRLGARDEYYTELLAGVLRGELVATKGSAGLRGALLIANLGEG